MQRCFIRAGHKKKGELNKLEWLYNAVLETLKRAEEIRDYSFERIKLRIGEACWYTPDFMVLSKENEIEFHEVKGGFITDDALVKFKAVCELYPYFKFIMMQHKGKQWKRIREN